MNTLLKVAGTLAGGVILASALATPAENTNTSLPTQTEKLTEIPTTSVTPTEETKKVPPTTPVDQKITPEPTKIEPAVKLQPKEEVAPESSCNPNYSGCLKVNAGDYDCIGGSGNGPNYTGKVQVLGSDPYGLDRDGDGWGCE